MKHVAIAAVYWIAVATVPLSSAFQQLPFSASSSTSQKLIHRLHSYAPQSVAIDIRETAPRDLEAFEDWAYYSCGVQRAEGFRLIAASDDDEVGLENTNVFAATASYAPAGIPVLQVPSFTILSSHRAMEELRSEDMKAAEKRIQDSYAGDHIRRYYLMLKILVEYEKGHSSPWYPWLNALPRYFSNAVSMTPFCYKCLPSLMASLAMKERANLNHLRVRRVPFLSESTKSNEALWTWAYQIVFTRSFEGPNGDLRIVPMADMINHGAEANIEMVYDSDDNCIVQTTRDIPAMSPLCMTYGDPTNPSFLFARYGFLDKSSPATFCKYIIDTPTKELRDMGYDPSRMLFYSETGEVSEEVWDVLLYRVLGEEQVQDQRAFYQAHMSGDVGAKQQYHQQYYPQTSSKLREHIDGFLEKLEELSQKTQGRDIREHPRLPLILRHNDFVRKTFLAVRARYFE